MPKTAKNGAFEIFFEKKCSKILPVSKMAVILHRFSTEISSSGLGRRPLTAETRVRVPVSLPNEAFSQLRLRAFVLFVLVLAIVSSRLPVPRLSRGPVSGFLAEVQQSLSHSSGRAEDIAIAAVLQF